MTSKGRIRAATNGSHSNVPHGHHRPGKRWQHHRTGPHAVPLTPGMGTHPSHRRRDLAPRQPQTPNLLHQESQSNISLIFHKPPQNCVESDINRACGRFLEWLGPAPPPKRVPGFRPKLSRGCGAAGYKQPHRSVLPRRVARTTGLARPHPPAQGSPGEQRRTGAREDSEEHRTSDKQATAWTLSVVDSRDAEASGLGGLTLPYRGNVGT